MTKLKGIRERNGLSQDMVAKALGVGRSSVAMWETSSAYPRGHTLVKLADLLHCTIDELFGRGEDGGAEEMISLEQEGERG